MSLHKCLKGHSNGVSSIAFSPDGQLIVSGSSDSTVRLWDAATGSCRSTLEGHSDGVLSVAFWPDSQPIASEPADYTIQKETEISWRFKPPPRLPCIFCTPPHVLDTGGQKTVSRFCVEVRHPERRHEDLRRLTIFLMLFRPSSSSVWPVTRVSGDYYSCMRRSAKAVGICTLCKSIAILFIGIISFSSSIILLLTNRVPLQCYLATFSWLAFRIL